MEEVDSGDIVHWLGATSWVVSKKGSGLTLIGGARHNIGSQENGKEKVVVEVMFVVASLVDSVGSLVGLTSRRLYQCHQHRFPLQ